MQHPNLTQQCSWVCGGLQQATPEQQSTSEQQATPEQQATLAQQATPEQQ